MPSVTIPVRYEPEKKQEILAAAAGLHMNPSDYVRAAVDEKLGKSEQASPEAQAAIQALEAEVGSLRVKLGIARSQLARISGHPDATPRAAAEYAAEQEFAKALAAANSRYPATAAGMVTVTGFDRNWNGTRFSILCHSGHARRIGRGAGIRYVAADGVTEDDIRDALAGMRGNITELAAEARRARDDTSPAHVLPVAAGEATQAAEGTSAATRNGRLAGARRKAAEVGAPLVAAKDVPRPGAAVFQPAGESKTVTEVPPGKPRGSGRKQCPHRLQPGAWCKTCQQPK